MPKKRKLYNTDDPMTKFYYDKSGMKNYTYVGSGEVVKGSSRVVPLRKKKTPSWFSI